MDLIQCQHCKQIMLSDTFHLHGETCYCYDCFNLFYVACGVCGRYEWRDLPESEATDRYNEVMATEHEIICEDCAGAIRVCDSCGTYMHQDDTYGTDLIELYYCGNCRARLIGYCGRHVQDYWLEHGCPDCNDEREWEADRECEDMQSCVNKTVTLSFMRAYGIEIECYANSGQLSERQVDNWESKEDGSLREDGAEYASPKLKGHAGLNSLAKVLDALNDNDHSVDKTCGLHVHIDATSFENDPKTVNRIGRLVYMWESLIYACLPESRRDSRYCKPLERGNLSSPSEGVYSGTRYYGFNVQALRRHSTLEFRYHSGTLSYEKIARYVKLCLQLVKIGKARKTQGQFKRKAKANIKNLMRFMAVLRLDNDDKRYWLKRYCYFQGVEANAQTQALEKYNLVPEKVGA